MGVIAAVSGGMLAARAGMSAFDAGIMRPISGALGRASQFGSFYNWPNVAPDLQSLIGAFWQGKIDRPTLIYAARVCCGVSLEAQEHNAQLHPWWNAILESTRPVVDMGTLVSMQRQGWPIPDDLYRRAGLTYDWQQRAAREWQEPLDLGSIYTLRDQGIIDRAGFIEAVKHAGLIGRVGQLWGVSRQPEVQSVMELYRRGYLTNQQLHDRLKALGFSDGELRLMIHETLWRVMPTPADFTLFAAREVWDGDVVERWGYDQEVPPEYTYWADRSGYNWSAADLPDTQAFLNFPDGPGKTLTHSRAQWRAHWRAIGVNQAFEMFHRFRNVQNLARWNLPADPQWVFDEADLARVLKIHDFPPRARPWLQALAHTPLQVREIRMGLRLQTITREQAIERFKDLGASDAVAAERADIGVAQAEESLRGKALFARRTWRARVRTVIKGYELGTIEENDARAQLVGLGFRPDESVLMTNQVELDWNEKLVRSFLTRVKKEFMDGVLSRDEAIAALQRGGILPGPAARHVDRWTTWLTGPIKRSTTAQILSYAKDGLLTIPQAMARLANLGWQQADLLLLRASLQTDIAEIQVKAAEARQKAQAQAVKEQQQALKQSRALVKQLQSDLRRAYPIGDLKRHRKSGYVTADRFRGLLTDMGYAPLDVQNLERELGDDDDDE